ncbi:MAG: DUF2029 domain-containing protein [Sphingomonas sp.]|nr:DUF2029 domain-containing protein [Sphingomonas sp.]
MDLARDRPLVLAAWLFGFVLVFQFAAFDIRYAITNGHGQSSLSTMIGRDFVNVFTAGHLTFDRGLATIYDVDAYRAYQLALFDGRVLEHNYSYTPVSFFYVWLFALPPYFVSYLLWIGLTGAAFALAARPYLREAGLPALVAVITPAAAMNVWAGHYGFLFGALWLAVWSILETRPRLAGVLVGLMIVKPHLAILMPLLLAARGAWRTFFTAAATVIFLVAASGFSFGWDLWRTYFTDTLFFQAVMVDHTGGFFLRMMPTAYPVFRLAGLGPVGAWALQAGFAVVAIGALLRWMPRDPKLAGLAGATATFLVLPYAFNYDMTVVGVAAAILLHKAPNDAALRRVSSALALLLPAAVIYTNHLGIAVAPFLLLLMLGGLLPRRSQEIPTVFPEKRRPA